MIAARVIRIMWATITRTRVKAGSAIRCKCSSAEVSGETLESA
jgi:hypothetical protein